MSSVAVVSVSIKVLTDEGGGGLNISKEVAHINITPIAVVEGREGYGDYKYMLQEPGGAIQEGVIENFHEDRGVLTLIGLAISLSGHFGQTIQVPAHEIANLLGHEKMEEIQGKLEEQGD